MAATVSGWNKKNDRVGKQVDCVGSEGPLLRLPIVK